MPARWALGREGFCGTTFIFGSADSEASWCGLGSPASEGSHWEYHLQESRTFAFLVTVLTLDLEEGLELS